MVEKSEEFSCVVPTIELVGTEEALSKVMQSHAWQVVKAEPYGTDAFLVKIVCSKCGLERTSIISNVQDSAVRAMQNRQKLLRL